MNGGILRFFHGGHVFDTSTHFTFAFSNPAIENSNFEAFVLVDRTFLTQPADLVQKQIVISAPWILRNEDHQTKERFPLRRI